ncbi:MAG: HU family DNA-binding protein [Candidatus Brocadiia bacterium]
MATISKKIIVERISEKIGANKNDVKNSIQSFLDMLIEELAQGNRFEFREFGVFEVITRRERSALNPKTMQRIKVPARAVVVFRPGKLMKESVNKIPPGEHGKSGGAGR